MTELIWLNGEVGPLADARIGVEDRGFQFADGVYEVMRVYRGRPFAMAEHLERLANSARGIDLPIPIPVAQLQEQIAALIQKSELREGMIYLQLTRGVSRRNHVFPKDAQATLLFHTRELPPVAEPGSGEGVKLITVADERWHRCWIKSIALLPNVLAKNAAVARGGDEAVFVENGVVSECSTSNIFAVIQGKLITHPVGSRVLPGITRAIVLDVARKLDMEVDERALREEEAARADELFITSTTRELAWVARWNDRYIGQGRCGPVTLKLHKAFRERIV